jgi:predicted kinase
MTEIMLLAGLPGSGKTTHLCRMLADGWLTFDDYKAQAFEDCSRFGSSRKFLPLISALRAGLKCVVADIDFCKPESREEAEGLLFAIFPNVQLHWLFFENNPSACEANVRNRNSASWEIELKKVREYSASYSIPRNADVLPVGRNASRCDTEN